MTGMWKCLFALCAEEKIFSPRYIFLGFCHTTLSGQGVIRFFGVEKTSGVVILVDKQEPV